MKVLVIGGGPAGMMAAITAAKNSQNEVIILEKMKMCGKKLLITGKGRCNITSSLPMEDFIKNTPRNGKFLYSAFNNFTNKDIINLLEKEGVQTKIERGNRVFPLSDKSIDVLKAFENILRKRKIKVTYNERVQEILVENQQVKGIKTLDGQIYYADKIILATGGKSYPNTGSTGDGYKLAKELGHNITKIEPSLIPLKSTGEDLNLCKFMQGLGLKNVGMSLIDIQSQKIIYKDFGEILFTHFGVSGPTILSASTHLIRYKNAPKLLMENKIYLKIDLKPALDIEKLNRRILRDFENEKNKKIINSLNELLPKKIIEPVLIKSKIDPNKKVNELTKLERNNLINKIKDFDILISGTRPIEEAIITSGGVDIKEVNPKTMESKKVEGLYFAGEILDVDSYTGGFNLQIAYSTGYTAGLLQ